MKCNLLLLLLVCSLTAIGLSVGWFAGSAVGGSNGPIGAAMGAALGTIIGVRAGYWRGLFETGWDSTLWRIPLCGCVIAGGVGALSDIPVILVALAAVIGSGSGAVLAKYFLGVFNDDPPPSIL